LSLKRSQNGNSEALLKFESHANQRCRLRSVSDYRKHC